MNGTFTQRPSAPLSALLISVAGLWMAGCTLGPNYKRPTVNAPDTYRGSTEGATAKTETASLGDRKWSEVFQDQQLQELIQTALQQNYDVRIAATRILQAGAQLGITRADQFPTINGDAQASAQRNPQSQFFGPYRYDTTQVHATFTWELDFWGKYRRATEAARADLAASEWGRRAIVNTVVSDVAGVYFQLRELDLELEISKRTLASRQDSLKLTQTLADHGINSMLDVRQAEQLVYTASAAIPDLERRIDQEENLLSVLVGKNPESVARGRKLTEQPHPPEVPAGLPSSLLERRPDIRQAEQELVAANARIGIAKAAYFPDISITGLGGFQSSPLANLFTGPAGTWNFAGSVTQPIFFASRGRSGMRLVEAQQQQALLTYQQTIQGAFREVSDALIAFRKMREFREQEEHLAQSAQDAAQLSDQRYKAGETSYLEVLTNQTTLFSAELGVAHAQLNELLSLVQLYRALGGGWQE